MERNSTIAAWRLPGGINSAVDKGVSAMILSYHDSVPPTFADKQVNAHGAPGLQEGGLVADVGRVPSPGGPAWCHNQNCCYAAALPGHRAWGKLSAGSPDESGI